jgi:hypothetical protein
MMRRLMTMACACLLLATAMSALAWGPNDPTDRRADPDGDRLSNYDEFRAGSNPLMPDSDLGGCWDGWEASYGLDPTNPEDDAFDSDNDGWDNLREFLEGTDPTNPNTDEDCYPLDSTDPRPLVPDGPWIIVDPGVGPVPIPDPPEPDTDEDGIVDSREPWYGTDPYDPDCDSDGLLDGRELDVGTDPYNPDSDGDGLLDGQEVQEDQWDWCYTATNPLKADTDGDGIGDYQDDVDGDGLPNGEEFKVDPATRLPVGWTDPRDADTDDDGVPDGAEVHGNPGNKGQTSDPLLRDTDGDRLADDIDPRTWVFDWMALSRVCGWGEDDGPVFPGAVVKGVPFNVEGRVKYNTTTYKGGDTGVWKPVEVAMRVQVWLEQDGRLVPISDAAVTGAQGAFKLACVIGDDVRAGQATLVITTAVHHTLAYMPVVWTDAAGNLLD